VPDIKDLSVIPSSFAAGVVWPASVASEWIVAIAEGGMTITDGTDPLRKGYSITDSTRNLLKRTDSTGTTLRLRLRYHAGDIPAAVPLVIRVFGAETATGDLAAMPNLNKDLSVPITLDTASDSLIEDGSQLFAVTTPDADAHSWDCDGYTFMLVGIEKPYTATGSPELARLEAKLI
jgi:hypothetical protein